MNIITIPAGTEIHAHKSTCRDISAEIYHGNTYDTCGHLTVSSKSEVPNVKWFPCTRKLAK